MTEQKKRVPRIPTLVTRAAGPTEPVQRAVITGAVQRARTAGDRNLSCAECSGPMVEGRWHTGAKDGRFVVYCSAECKAKGSVAGRQND